jgi:uncharacterized membrane protein YidH (DUF202 family)
LTSLAAELECAWEAAIMTARAQHIREVEDRVKTSLYLALNSSFVLSIILVLVLAFVFVLASRK